MSTTQRVRRYSFALFVLIFPVVIDVCYSAAADGGGVVVVEKANVNSNSDMDFFESRCFNIPDGLAMCRRAGYTKLRLPNVVYHESLREAEEAAAQWKGLLQRRPACASGLELFLCAIYAPVCLDNSRELMLPCRGLCESVKAGCLPALRRFNFRWPRAFNCSQFPPLYKCVDQGQKERHKSTQCAQCKKMLIANIRESFCSSSHVFKARIISLSRAGTQLKINVRIYKRRVYKGVFRRKRQDLVLSMGESTCNCPLLDSFKSNARVKKLKVLVMGVYINSKLQITVISKWTRKWKDSMRSVRCNN